MGKRGDHSFQPTNMHIPYYHKHSGHRTPCGSLDPGIADWSIVLEAWCIGRDHRSEGGSLCWWIAFDNPWSEIAAEVDVELLRMPNYIAADSFFVDSTTHVRGDPNLTVSVISRFFLFCPKTCLNTINRVSPVENRSKQGETHSKKLAVALYAAQWPDLVF